MFSPCYNHEHIIVPLSHVFSAPRTLNYLGYLPFAGVAVGAYRILTGLIDIIAGIAYALFASFSEGIGISGTGISNIIRGSFECSHFIFACAIPTVTLIEAGVATGCVTGLALYIYDTVYSHAFFNDPAFAKGYSSLLYYDSIPAYATELGRDYGLKAGHTLSQVRDVLLTEGVRLSTISFA